MQHGESARWRVTIPAEAEAAGHKSQNCGFGNILTELIGCSKASGQAPLYDDLRLGKEGALSRYHLNYLL